MASVENSAALLSTDQSPQEHARRSTDRDQSDVEVRVEEHGGNWEPEKTGNQQLEKIVHIPWYSVIVDHSPMSVPSVFDHVDTQNWGCNQQLGGIHQQTWSFSEKKLDTNWDSANQKMGVNHH